VNFKRYAKHESIISRQELDSGDTTVPFPIIIACSNNMHMASKLINFPNYYPIVNRTVLKAFYGAKSISGIQDLPAKIMMDRNLTIALDNISLRQFFQDTRPNYGIGVCKFGTYNCRRDWELVGTVAGKCLRFDPNHHKNYASYDSLLISFKLINEQYMTGWKESSGITIYTTNLGERNVLVPSHGMEIDAQAVPIITLQNVKRLYLGWPYTPCMESSDEMASNDKMTHFTMNDQDVGYFDQQNTHKYIYK